MRGERRGRGRRGGENERRVGDTFDSLRLLNPPIVAPAIKLFIAPNAPALLS